MDHTGRLYINLIIFLVAIYPPLCCVLKCVINALSDCLIVYLCRREKLEASGIMG